MSHAFHFLERGAQRLERGDLDLAMRLYREPELVEFILKRASLPAGDGRIACACTPTARGPMCW